MSMMIYPICLTTSVFSQTSSLKDHEVQNPVDISADRLEVKQKENIALFTGNVVVNQDEMSLLSDRITVFYDSDREEGKSSSISRLDASGNVVMRSLTETIKSTWGVYDFSEKIITLGGNVELSNADGAIKGQRLQLNLITGQITIEGTRVNGQQNERVSGQFTPPQ
jgi:lipopolysaccharide export system protein LptA